MKLISTIVATSVTLMSLFFIGCSSTEAKKENSTYESIRIDDSINKKFTFKSEDILLVAKSCVENISLKDTSSHKVSFFNHKATVTEGDYYFSAKSSFGGRISYAVLYAKSFSESVKQLEAKTYHLHGADVKLYTITFTKTSTLSLTGGNYGTWDIFDENFNKILETDTLKPGKYYVALSTGVDCGSGSSISVQYWEK